MSFLSRFYYYHPELKIHAMVEGGVREGDLAAFPPSPSPRSRVNPNVGELKGGDKGGAEATPGFRLLEAPMFLCRPAEATRVAPIAWNHGAPRQWR